MALARFLDRRPFILLSPLQIPCKEHEFGYKRNHNDHRTCPTGLFTGGKAAAERTREKKLKFSFKEQREFETIDDELAELEANISACLEEQGNCGSDYVKLQELQARQEELEARLEAKMERWVYLNELKEKIDAQ